ncbi:MAG: hypothetical protein AUG51_04800 [Acidobacteria bacterium 13_1_20CM_3_53_8]|nr:MAG: hypothetical protein AUG51_04800 [Acidobacteria bacterium 13_1_20CM_3_53_8]
MLYDGKLSEAIYVYFAAESLNSTKLIFDRIFLISSSKLKVHLNSIYFSFLTNESKLAFEYVYFNPNSMEEHING